MSQACSYAGLSILPPSSTPSVEPARERKPLRGEIEKPKERPDALTMVSHFVKRKKEKKSRTVYHRDHGTYMYIYMASYFVHDSDSKNQYLERGLLVTLSVTNWAGTGRGRWW